MAKINVNHYLLLIMTVVSMQASADSQSNGFSLIEYEKLISKKPDSEDPRVRVWKIRQNETIRVNLVEMTGELPLHKHPDAEHSLMVLDGRIKVKVADKLHVMSKGDFISIPADVPHKYWSLAPKTILVSMDAPYYDPAKTVVLE